MKITFNFSALQAAVEQMGTQPIVFKAEKTLDPIKDIDIRLHHGIEIPLSEVKFIKSVPTYEGRQVLLYIQDHGNNVQQALIDGSTGNRFHVADCKTLNQMRNHGRFKRYVVTNRIDGEFFITGRAQGSGKSVKGHTRLLVCQNCLCTLSYQGANPNNAKKIAQNFDIALFFASCASFLPHQPPRSAGYAAEDDDYTSDWSQVATSYKTSHGYRCEQCGVNLSEHKGLLHTHHCNGIKSDNRPENLRALCADCHRRQPYHSWVIVAHDDMQTLNRLRQQQGLLRNRSWKTVFDYVDPGLRGVLDMCQREGIAVPEIGWAVADRHKNVVANLEVAWPRSRVGIAIADQDRNAAQALGWQVWGMVEVMDDIDKLVRRLN